MGIAHQFGGSWTEDKLSRLERYLVAYKTALKDQPFNTIYVDAFAGTGSRVTRRPTSPEQNLSLFEEEVDSNDAETYHRGSAQVALAVEPPFQQYIFVDANPRFVAELETLRVQFPARADSIRTVNEDANGFLRRWCQELAPLDRAVVFLDPYGMSVDWVTVSDLAATQKVDLWIFFPLGVAVNRLLTRRQPPPKPWADALTRFFGDSEWEGEFYKPSAQPGLFEEGVPTIKGTDFDSIAAYFTRRLGTVFARVSPHFLTLRNSRNSPLFLLCFASANPRGAHIAVRIADHILKE